MNLRMAAIGKARNECRILTEERLGKWTLKLRGFGKIIF
jgi:hypothetical protein